MLALDYKKLIEDVPTLSFTFESVSTLLATDDIRLLERYILKDTYVSSKIVSAANTVAANRTRGPVLDVQFALKTIGLKWAKNIILSSVYSGPFKGDRCPQFDADFYWSDSVHTGLMVDLISKSIDHPCGNIRSGGLIAGMVSNVGLPFMAHYFPSETNKALLIYKNTYDRVENPSLKDVLFKVTSIDYKILGSMILEQWGLPNEIVVVPTSEDSVPRLQGDLRSLLALTHAWKKDGYSSDSRALNTLSITQRKTVIETRDTMLAEALASVTALRG